MKVQVLFTIETEDFGKAEFKKEIEKLIKDIDPNTQLLFFNMWKIEEKRNGNKT